MAEDERPDDDDNGEAGSTVHILGSTPNPIDLYVSTPSRTKWIFVDDLEKEVDNTTIKLKEKVA